MSDIIDADYEDFAAVERKLELIELNPIVEAVPPRQDRAKGTPKYSYLFANATAAHLIRMHAPYNLEPSRIMTSIQGWLSRSGTRQHDGLAHAFVQSLQLLESQLTQTLAVVPHAWLDSLEDLCAQYPRAVAELCSVYEFGESKYSRGNYRKGDDMTAYVDHALSHLIRYTRGDDTDESGYHALAHCAWNLWQALDQPEFRDDRLPAAYAPPKAGGADELQPGTGVARVSSHE